MSLAPAAATAYSAPRTLPFYLDHDRDLASSWMRRAIQNIEAIRLSRTLERNNHTPNRNEQLILARFIGFGATELANGMFPDPATGTAKSAWQHAAAELKAVTTEQEYASLRRATQYAHFTPEFIVDAIWAGLRRLGFAGGEILDAGFGTGLFLARLPEELRDTSHMTGIENDPVTARIARQLYGQATIIEQDFRETILQPGFALVVGNPPYSVNTVTSDRAWAHLRPRLHDYFILKSLDALAPEGLAAFVTSQGTLNKTDTAIRAAVFAHSDLVGAIRLPEGSFSETAGTSVGVDILFFRKRRADEAPADGSWVNTVRIRPGGTSLPAIRVNEWFIHNPGMVLGTHAQRRGRYGPEPSYTCLPRPGQSLGADLDTAVRSLPPLIARPVSIRTPMPCNDNPPGLFAVKKDGSFDILDGELVQWSGRRTVPVPVRSSTQKTGIPATQAEIIKMLIPIRDAVRDVLKAQQADEDWSEPVSRLNNAYDTFVFRHGPINMTKVYTRTDPATGEVRESFRRPNLQPFMQDPDAWLVSSIESYDRETGHATKRQIFSQRIIAPPPPPKITTTADALAWCLDRRGKVDIDLIASKASVTTTEAIATLGDAIFRNPANGRWETRDEYLSGDVRSKLKIAHEAALVNESYKRNVSALELAIPPAVPPSEISARLGAPWIPTTTVEAFIKEVIGADTTVTHTPEAAIWTIKPARYNSFDSSIEARWGTTRRSADLILSDILNNNNTKIYDEVTVDGKKTRVINIQQTDAVKDKATIIRADFENWVWTDPRRALDLANLYNEKYNNLAPREYDGSHLTLSNANNTFSFYPKQKRTIWRVVANGTTYIAHAVGAGKTATMIASVMEQKRLGLINKALIAVPGHSLAQFANEFLFLYPQARIMVADEVNFSADNRRSFLARATTGDWDAIIITHSAFKLIPCPPAFERIFIEDQKVQYEHLITEATDRLTIKRLEAMKERFENRLEMLSSRKDDFLDIADLGIDQIVVDEAHEFRKLSFVTNMSDLKGIDPNGSQMSWDLYVKSQFISQKYTSAGKTDRSLVLASGTPIVNTIGELYTLLRYCNEALLSERNIQHFDAWANTFASARTELEMQPSGTYKPVTRLTEFENVPELFALFRQVADVVLHDELREYVKLPALRTGARQMITSTRSEPFIAYQKQLAERIKMIENRTGQAQKGDDILLSVISDGRHAAIDLRLVGGDFVDPEGKLAKVIENTLAIYTASRETLYRTGDTVDPIPGSLQLIFCDLGTPNALETRGFSAYFWIRDELIRLGIPEKEIAIVHDAKRIVDKERMFEAARTGRIAVVIGSSQKMGTATNVQKRLIALHHVCVPWFPSLIEQRDGRILRQGNQNETVDIFAYATLGSTDATMWQKNEQKARFISAAMTGDRTVRKIEDIDNQAAQFAIAKAISSGDPRLMEKAGVEADIAKLKRMEANHYNSKANMVRTIDNLNANIDYCKQRIKMIENDIALRNANRNQTPYSVGGQGFRDPELAGKAIADSIYKAVRTRRRGRFELALIRGFPIIMKGTLDSSGTTYAYEILMQRSNSEASELRITSRTLPATIIDIIDSLIQDLESDRDQTRGRIADMTRQIASLEPETTRSFPYAETLAERLLRLDELEQDLAANPQEPDPGDEPAKDAA